ncbi:hypothetical protein [Streptomyces hawaiiensis]|uniref:Uncharacterized protein n=1 Tax=Streptomyces hawaiiensis TaxID=67305 RepID=A0A6G5RRZ9_9ACTN|nr:hypothetical protein [Streptomyces hawaiiensis]QCD60332.1 hypothetical protein CEB94_40695 [Streptomyces hawaiiensis]
MSGADPGLKPSQNYYTYCPLCNGIFHEESTQGLLRRKSPAHFAHRDGCEAAILPTEELLSICSWPDRVRDAIRQRRTEQQHFTQNNTDGVDATLFVQLAGYVGQISSTLGMPEPERAELERVAQDLHDEATSENPEPGRLRQFTTQLKDKLGEAGTTMAATMGVQMAEQALGALGQ